MRRLKRLRRGRAGAGREELDITAFLNLMVILIPFLLITAVFSRLAIVELGMATSAQSETPPEGLQLDVVVRNDVIEVRDQHSLIRALPRQGADAALDGLRRVLMRIKARFPEHSSITVLVSPDVSYETLIQVMDHVRLYPRRGEAGEVVQAALFPDISLGDAPPPDQQRQ
jgi:biopolymer transport protein ExbD